MDEIPKRCRMSTRTAPDARAGRVVALFRPCHGSSLPRIRISNDVANSEWQGSAICIAA